MTIGDGYVNPRLDKEKEKVSERVEVTPERGIPSRQKTDLPRHQNPKRYQALNFPKPLDISQRGHKVRGLIHFQYSTVNYQPVSQSLDLHTLIHSQC